MMSSGPPPLPVKLLPHRAQKILILAVIAFLFAPCGFVALIMAKRDLKAMQEGRMDPKGEQPTRSARKIAIIASIVWMIKWTIFLTTAFILYYYFKDDIKFF